MTDAPPRDSTDPGAGSNGGWRTALALVVFILGVSVVGPGVLVGLPFLLLVTALPTPRKGAFLWAGLAGVWVFGLGLGDAMWHFERGWAVLTAGWFLGITLRWPHASLTHRAIGAVGGAGLASASLFRARPELWAGIDWRVQDRLTEGVGQAMAILEGARGGEGLPAGVEESVMRTVETQGTLFPAFLGLASVAGLAVAWWMYRRVAVGDASGLGRVRDFRFSDQMVWVFIAGLALVALGIGDGWERAGSNTLVFMGALYALRGAAVVLFLNGGLTLFGAVLLGMGMIFVAPVLLMGALLLGLSDTWLDVRNRVRATET